MGFVRYLREFGWQPTILTANPRAYERVSEDRLKDIPPGVDVIRAFALDTGRHLAIGTRYSRLLALPDRWVSWMLGAVPAGLNMIRNLRPDVIFSTYPIASAHLIGLTLRKLTGVPWVADFRDPMTDGSYPPDPKVRRAYQWIERKTVENASRMTVTTPGTAAMYAGRFPKLPAGRIVQIENGYEEESFSSYRDLSSSPIRSSGRLTLLHSGLMYPSERDPRPFMKALQEVARETTGFSEKVRIVLRAPGHENYLGNLISQFQVGNMVEIAPPIPYQAALQEMLNADGLLIFQATNCNHQIPAKVYEYLRARRPILAITDPNGDTANTLRGAGIDTITKLDSSDDIKRDLVSFVGRLTSGNAPLASEETITRFSRKWRAKELANLFDELATH